MMPAKTVKKRGRPPQSKIAVKSEVLGLRFTASEKEGLEFAAQNKGQRLSEWAKEILLAQNSACQNNIKSIAKKIESRVPSAQILAQQLARASISTPSCSLNSYMVHIDKFVRSIKSISKKDLIQELSLLIQANKKISRYLRQAALNTRTIAAISALYDDCIDTCHFLAKTDIANEVKNIAGQRASFPVAAYQQPLLNNRIRTLLNEVKPGIKLHGLRKEAKWLDSPFVREALRILDHTDALIFDLEQPTPAYSQAKFALMAVNPVRLMPGSKKFVRLHKLVSAVKPDKMDQDKLWRIIDSIIIGEDDPKTTRLCYRYDSCWEDIFKDRSLSKSNGKELKQKEIKNRIKRAFLTLYPVVYS